MESSPNPVSLRRRDGLALRREGAEPDALGPPSAAGGSATSASGSMVVTKGEEHDGHEDQ
jgi:hypothetical protein